MKCIRGNLNIFIPLCALIIIVLSAIFAGFISPADPSDIDLTNKFAEFSFAHPLGTDHLGRDTLSRLIYGVRTSLLSVLCISVLILITSLTVGSIAGYKGGTVDAILMRTCDVFLTFPTFILALFLIGVLGVGLINVIIAITLTHWAWYARFVRGLVLEFKSKGYILAAKVAGTSDFKIVIKHILPSVIVQLLILSTLDIGHMLLHVAGLSFLGLGVQAPTPEWGVMINDAVPYIREHPILMVLPGLCIFITVAILNTLGEALRDKLDPALNNIGVSSIDSTSNDIASNSNGYVLNDGSDLI